MIDNLCCQRYPGGLTEREWRTLPYAGPPERFHHLLCAVLLQACLDAHDGDEGARRFISSPQAREWADLVDLPAWPPLPEQLGNRSELRQRAGRALRPVNEVDGPLGRIRSRNPADDGEMWVWDGRDDGETRAVLPAVEQWESVLRPVEALVDA